MHDGRRILVVGMLQPRDPAAMLDALEVDDSTLVIACPADRRRARCPPSEIAAAAVGARRRRRSRSPTSAEPSTRARRLADPDDAVLVTGSLYVVGAARTHVLRRH